MNGDCLVLDNNWKPVSVMSWMDIMTLHAKDRVWVVESDPERVLRSPSFEINMPVVVQLKNKFARKQRREVPFSRRNVAVRDRSACQYCGVVLETHEYTFDHVVPRSRGGKSSWKNLVLCCEPCNKRKSDHMPEDVNMWPRTDPKKPDVNDPRFQFRLRIKRMKPQWKPFESYLYWNVELDP